MVRIEGLPTASQYNGCDGEVQEYDSDTDRYVVVISSMSLSISVRLWNLWPSWPNMTCRKVGVHVVLDWLNCEAYKRWRHSDAVVYPVSQAFVAELTGCQGPRGFKYIRKGSLCTFDEARSYELRMETFPRGGEYM